MKRWYWVIMIAGFSCVNQASVDEDKRTKTASQVQPRPLFVSDKIRAELLSPAPVQILTGGNPIGRTLLFDLKIADYGSVLIFNAPVTAAEFNSGATAGRCIAGASSLAGHAWNGVSIRLDSAASGLSQVYVCDGSNTTEPLSKTTKFTTDSLAAGTYYYWLVLGYDKSKILKSVSGLERFRTP